jgi:hypothetical protein
MSYLETLKNNNADKLWCGKGSTYDCVLALLHAIERENWDSEFPESENLYNLLVFVENDNSNRFFNRLKQLEAPPNTGRIPLCDAKSNLLAKLVVNRLDTVCVDYFHSDKSSEWVARNTYGEKLLKFWNIFNTQYIKTVLEFVKSHKSSPKVLSSDEVQAETSPESKIDSYKTIASKLHGVWASKVNTKIEKIQQELSKPSVETKQTEKTDKKVESTHSEKKNTEKKVVVKREPKITKYNKQKQPEDDGQGEWTKVTNKKKVSTTKT